MAWARASLGIDGLHKTPLTSGDTIPMKIIDSIVAVIASKNVNTPVVDHCGVPIPWRRRLGAALWNDLYPVVGLETKLEKIVSSVGSIIASEDIKIVFHRNRCMKRSRARRMALIGLGRLNLMPGVWFFKEMVSGTSNYVDRVE